MAERLAVLVAVERFKTELTALNLTEEEIQDALDRAVSKAVENPYNLIAAMRFVADEEMMKRNPRWDSETKDAISSIADTKEP